MSDGGDLTLWAVTNAGLVRLAAAHTRAEAALRRPDADMRCLAVGPAGVLYVGARGVWKTADGGDTWHDLAIPEPNVFSLAAGPDAVYAGTEPSKLFKSRDAGGTWRELEELRRLPSAPTWSFPPRPWTSHVRWIAPNPADPDLLLVGIELGGVMRSDDGGATWEDHRPGAQKDCHALAWHPVDTRRAYEAAGGGAAWSRDGGSTWTAADEGLDHDYVWALAVDPQDPDRWFVSANPGPGRAHSDGDARAHIYRWEGAGPWRQLSGGLPQPLSSMPYVLRFAGDRLFAGLRDGRLFASDDRGDSWIQLYVDGADLAGLRALEPA